MWCWRRIEKISWTDHVGHEEMLQRVKKEANILYTIKRKANWIGHKLRRNCLLNKTLLKERYMEEMRGRQGKRRKELLDDCKEKIAYWKMKKDALCGELALEETMDLS
jgi:replicative superfamily II helicase